MMKRWKKALSLLLAAAMCMSLLCTPAFAETGMDGCEHEWKHAEDGTYVCDICGAPQSDEGPGEDAGDVQDGDGQEEDADVDGEEEEPATFSARQMMRTASNEEGGVDPQAEGGVAKIGETTYATLQEAINAATDGVETTITMTADVEGITTAITVPAGKVIVLDMAGHKITVSTNFSGRAIENKGDLTVQGDGTIDASGSSDGWGAINNLGTLTIENGTFRGNSESGASNIRNYGKDAALVINDGTFDTSSTAVLNYDGLTTLNGGTYTTHDHNCSSCGNNWSYVIRTYTDGKEGVYPRLYVNGGTYTGTQGALSTSVGYLEVNDGTFKTVDCKENHGAIFYPIYAAGEYGEVKCVINGGTFENTGTRAAVYLGNDNPNGDGGINADAISHVYGGTFIAPKGVPALMVSERTAAGSIIHGGTYTLLDEAAQKYLDPDVQAVQGADGKYVVGDMDEIAVAKIGDKPYVDLATALDAAKDGENKTVTILKAGEYSPITVPDEVTVQAAEGVAVTFKGSFEKTVKVGANVTFNNLTFEGANPLNSSVGDNLTVENCTFEGDGSDTGTAMYIHTPNITVKNCTFKNYRRGYYTCGDNHAIGKIEFTGNTFENVKIPFDGYWGKKADDRTQVTITGNKFDNGGEPVYVCLWDYTQYLNSNQPDRQGSALDNVTVRSNAGNYQLQLIHTDWRWETPEVTTDNTNVVYCSYVEVENADNVTALKAQWAGEGELPDFMDHTTATKKNGKFYFYEIPAGKYNVTVTYTNGASVTQEFEVIPQTAGENITQKLTLSNSEIPAVARIGETKYQTLEAAFNAVNQIEGDETVTLTISEGTFSPAQVRKLLVTRGNVVIQGSGQDKTTIDCKKIDVDGQAGVYIGANNVTLKDMTITTTSDNGIDAVKVSYTNSAETQPLLTNIKLENLTLNSTSGHGLNLHGVDGATVTNVTATGTKCGLSLANAKNVTVSGSNLTGKWGSVGMMYTDNALNGTYNNPVTLTLGGGNTFAGVIYSERSTENKDTVTVDTVYTVDIVGALVKGSEKLTTSAVAKIGNETDGVQFLYTAAGSNDAATLQAAITAAKSGDTVKLLKDVEITDGILISKKNNITLDGGNHTISVKGNAQVHGIQVWQSTGIKVNDLTITGAGKDALLVNQGSSVTATNLTTSGSGWGAVNVDKNSTFELVSGTLNETNKIWKDDAGSQVKVPSGWDYYTVGGQTFYSTGLSLTMSQTSATLYTNGTNTVALTVSGAPAGTTVTWTSSNPAVATVDANGRVTAVANGTATITAAVGTMTAACTVTVTRRSTGGGGGGGTYRPAQPNPPETEIDEPDVPLAQPFLFTDVNEGDWFYDNVKYVFDKGMMKGTNDAGTIFNPAGQVTRGMLVTILYRLEDTPAVTAAPSFSDVAAGQYYTDAVVWANANEIVTGFEDGTFRPNAPVTREQMAVILYRYAAFKSYQPSGSADLSGYADASSIGAYAQEAMQWANAAALITGNNNCLMPQGDASRAQAAAILNRFCENVAK